MSTTNHNPSPACRGTLARVVFALAALMVLGANVAHAQTLMKEVPAKARGLEIDERLGATLPMDAEFVNSHGDCVTLGSYFSPAIKPDGTPNGATGKGKPTVVAMVYYSCETACSVVMSKMAGAFQVLDYKIGTDFNVLTVSFKQEEGTYDADAAKSRYVGGLARGESDAAVVRGGWQFHTGTPENSQKLADALGFKYRRLENGEYSHPVAIFVVTPDGRISRYMYGFDYDPGILKMALLEASNGTIAKSITDRFLHLCYKYDPNAGVYTLQAFRVMQIGGVLAMVAVGGLIIALRVGEALKRRRALVLGRASGTRAGAVSNSGGIVQGNPVTDASNAVMRAGVVS